MIPDRPYLRDGVDVYIREDFELHFVFLASRKRIIVRASSALIESLVWLDGTKSKADLFQQFADTYVDERVENFKAFLSYLAGLGIVANPNWDTELGLGDSVLALQKRQLAFLLDVLGTPKRVAEVQLKFGSARITCFGTGAVGSWLLRLLIGMGFRNFNLIDHGKCDSSDISRHAFHGSTGWAEGTSKVKATAAAMREHFSDMSITTFDEPLTTTSDLAKLIPKSTDLVINAADEPYIGYTSVLLSRHCVPRRLPLLVAGGFDAHLASLGEMIVPYETPCADCYADFFRDALADWIPISHPVAERSKGSGGLCGLSVFSASAAAMSIMRLFSGFSFSESGRGELIFDHYALENFRVERREDCLICGSK